METGCHTGGFRQVLIWWNVMTGEEKKGIIGVSKSGFAEENFMKDKNDLKLLDIMCKWYIWAVVGLVIGNWLSDTLGSLIGLAMGSLIGWYIQKNYNKNDNW